MSLNFVYQVAVDPNFASCKDSVKEQVNDKSGSVGFESGYASDDHSNESGSETIIDETVAHIGIESAPTKGLKVYDLTGSKKSSDPLLIASADTFVVCKKEVAKNQGSSDRKAWKQKRQRRNKRRAK